MARRINKKLLKQKIEEMGLAEASIATGIGLSTLEKLRAGTYPSTVKRKTVSKLCEGLKVAIDDLWPEFKKAS